MSQTESITAETDCPPVSRLEMMAHGDLPDPGLTLCLTHLKTCEACSARLSALLDSPEKPRFRWVDSDSPPPVFMPELPAPPDKGPALDPPLVPGDLGSIGAIRLLHVIGKGHTAIAFTGYDTRLDRAVVVKVLLPRVAKVPQLAEEFFAEGRAAARLEHPGIVPILWVDTFKGLPFIVMPQLRGESLAARLGKGPMSPKTVRQLLPQVVDALELAHSRNLVHRDIKPANMWLHRDMQGQRRIVLLDFGIAGQFNSKGLSSGTRGYRSPEQAAGEPCDHRSDFFSLGCVLFEMLTGRRAWPPNGGMETVEPLAADPAVPAPWKPLLKALLRWDPARRPATHAALRALIPPEAPARARWLAPVAAGGMLLLMLAFGVAWMAVWKPGPRPGAPFEIAAAAPTAPVPAAPVAAGMKPRLVLPGVMAMPAAISGDGKVVAMARAGAFALFSSIDGSPMGEFQAGAGLRHLELDRAGALVAATYGDRRIDIHRLPGGEKEASFIAEATDVPGAWCGVDGDRLLFPAGGKLVVATCSSQDRKWTEKTLPLPVPSGWKPVPAVRCEPCPGSDRVAVAFSDQSLGVIDTATGKRIQFHHALPFPGGGQARLRFWKDPNTFCMVSDRKVMELEVKEKGPRDIAFWETPCSAIAFAWVGASEYALLFDAGGRRPSLSLGQRGKRATHADLDVESAWMDSLSWIPSSRTLAAFGRDGSVRLYELPAQ